MPASICGLCEDRRARRWCPGVRQEICAQCCGEKREIEVDCPLDCEHLMEARKHERPPVMALEQFPNQDVRVTETFLRDHEELLLFFAHTTLRAGLDTAGAVDLDAREAFDSMIRTYRTLESGLIYETRPSNPYAASIQQRLQQGVDEYRKAAAERSGMHTIRDTDILGVLVFLQRLELQENNGRKRGRAFFDFLRAHFPMPTEGPLVQT